MTLIKGLLMAIIGYIIMRHTNNMVGDTIGLIGIIVGVLIIVVREIKLGRGD
jgi:hypothetical protein